MTKVKPGHRT